MIHSELLNALQMVADEKSIDLADLIETIEEAVTKAAAKRLNRENLDARFDKGKGKFDLYEILEVVDAPEKGAEQISAEEAAALDPAASVGDMVRRHVEMEDLGRIAAQSVRQMIHKKGRELEQMRLENELKSRIGSMVTGKVIRRAADGYLIDLGDAEAILPKIEQIAQERLERGRTVKLIITGVTSGRGEPLVTVSRRHPDLLAKLMEIEIPEVADGVVEIVALARDNQGRSKVAVRSGKPDVDPVGSCVGTRGNRIQMIMKELSGEKIDVFEWSDNPEKLIALALAPARNLDVILVKNEKKAYVVVPDDQLSLAIGKKGSNIKLAVKLTGWELDVMSLAEYQELKGRLDKGKTGGGKTGPGDAPDEDPPPPPAKVSES